MKFNFRLDLLSILIILNVGLFGIFSIASLVLNVDYGELMILLGSHIDGVSWLTQTWWRVIVSSFLHASEWHLISNLIGLYIIGRWVQLYYGEKGLFLIYFLGGISGGLFTEIFLDNFASIGASSSYFAILGVVIINVLINDPDRKAFPWSRNVIFFLLGLLALEAVVNVAGNEMVNNAAHLGGFVAGIFYGYFIKHRLSVNIPAWQLLFQFNGYRVAQALTFLAFVAMIFNLIWVIFFI